MTERARSGDGLAGVNAGTLCPRRSASPSTPSEVDDRHRQDRCLDHRDAIGSSVDAAPAGKSRVAESASSSPTRAASRLTHPADRPIDVSGHPPARVLTIAMPLCRWDKPCGQLREVQLEAVDAGVLDSRHRIAASVSVFTPP